MPGKYTIQQRMIRCSALHCVANEPATAHCLVSNYYEQTLREQQIITQGCAYITSGCYIHCEREEMVLIKNSVQHIYTLVFSIPGIANSLITQLHDVMRRWNHVRIYTLCM